MVDQTSISACRVCFCLYDSAPKTYRFEYAELEDAVRNGCETCFIVMEGIEKVANSVSPEVKPSIVNLQRVQEGHPFAGIIVDFEDLVTQRVRIEFYSVGDSPWPWNKLQVTSHIQPLEPPLVSRLDAAIEWVKHELEECVKNHPSCKRELKNAKAQPSRILDLHPGLLDDSVCLTHLDDGFDAPYIAFSHCWGKTHLITTTKASLSDRCREIKVQDLPKTFQDAVKITRNLDIRYLWIDSLCIVQDDLKDWEIESSKMASIYAGSYLTISAVSAKNSTRGCIPDHTPSYFKIGAKGRDNQIVYARHPPMPKSLAHMELTGAWTPLRVPLLSRAWVFQERILSPYMAHFHESDIFYECKSSLHCQCGETHTKYNTGNSPWTSVRPELAQIPYEMLFKTWDDIVSAYSALLLTNTQDKLPALSGIASIFATNFGESQYLAGLWKNLLPRTLLWHHNYLNKSIPNVPQVYQAPSWSWAAINRPVSFSEFGKAHPDFAILDIWCKVPGENPYGRTTDGQLKLQGLYLESPTLDIKSGEWNICLRFLQLDLHFRFYPDDIENCLSLDDGSVVPWIAVLVSNPSDVCTTALVLKKSEAVSGSYFRVGFGTCGQKGFDNILAHKDVRRGVFIII